MVDVVKVVDTSTVINIQQGTGPVAQIPVSTTSINVVDAGQIILAGGGSTATSSAVAAVNVGAGQPLNMSKVNGQVSLASAATFNISEVIGLATAAAASGFVASFTRGLISLADWTAATGSATLQRGADYFLSATAGLLTTTPPQSVGQSVVFVGTAVSATDMQVSIEPAVLL